MEVSDTSWNIGDTVYYYIKNDKNLLFKKSRISKVTITIEGEFNSKNTVYTMYNGDIINECMLYDTPTKLYDSISSKTFSTVLNLDIDSSITIKL
jgi:hypothetical protein